MAAKKKSNEIKITRIYDAPIKAVWEAWVDPKQAAKWWGPRGFTITTHGKDLRPGGFWKYTMHGPDGVDYPNHAVYYEVEKYAKLVYDHGGNENQPPLFRVTALFSEVKGGKTKLEMTMALETPEKAEQTRKFIKSAGGDSTWDRLAEYLEKESTGKEKFVINRTFDISINKMFEIWTSPAHIANWMAPKGFSMKYHRVDIKPGGSCFYSMSNDANMTMYGRAQYLTIERPNLIVYKQQFCDENERITRHPMSPTWPESMTTTVLLTEESPESTRVTITWQPDEACTSEELKTFVQGRSGMTQGWTGSLDKLEEFILTNFS